MHEALARFIAWASRGLNSTRFSRVLSPVLIAACLFGGAPPIAAQPSARPWAEEKCVRYKEAWSVYLKRIGTRGLSDGFMTAHQAFIDGGCLQGRVVCPRSSEEFDAANAMTIRAMNAGTASTFLPFACKR